MVTIPTSWSRSRSKTKAAALCTVHRRRGELGGGGGGSSGTRRSQLHGTGLNWSVSAIHGTAIVITGSTHCYYPALPCVGYPLSPLAALGFSLEHAPHCNPPPCNQLLRQSDPTTAPQHNHYGRIRTHIINAQILTICHLLNPNFDNNLG